MLRFWPRFSLRAILIATAICAMVFAILASRYHKAQRIANAVELLSSAGNASVHYRDLRSYQSQDKWSWQAERERDRPKSVWGFMFADVVALVLVDVGDRELAGLQDALEELSNLRDLWLNSRGIGEPLTDDGLSYLAHLKSLERLDLGSASVSGKGLVHLRSLTRLRELHLDKTNVSDADLDMLLAFPQLEYLSLEGTNIGDAGLKRLERLANLQQLDIRDTKVTPAAAAEFEVRHPKCSIVGRP